MNILVVDDEKEIADVIELYLQNDKYTVFKFYSGEEALECVAGTKIDLAILDVMLPGIDGFEILKKIREKYTFPVIMLTAKTATTTVPVAAACERAGILCLSVDTPDEGVKAQHYLQYNDGGKGTDDMIDFAGLLLNKTSHECIYNEKHLTLTPTEFQILWILCENRGKVISSQELFESVWNEKYYKNSNNTVMVHIRHLREKMSGPTGKSDFIKTVWGVGYKVEE